MNSPVNSSPNNSSSDLENNSQEIPAMPFVSHSFSRKFFNILTCDLIFLGCQAAPSSEEDSWFQKQLIYLGNYSVNQYYFFYISNDIISFYGIDNIT